MFKPLHPGPESDSLGDLQQEYILYITDQPADKMPAREFLGRKFVAMGVGTLPKHSEQRIWFTEHITVEYLKQMELVVLENMQRN